MPLAHIHADPSPGEFREAVFQVIHALRLRMNQEGASVYEAQVSEDGAWVTGDCFFECWLQREIERRLPGRFESRERFQVHFFHLAQVEDDAYRNEHGSRVRLYAVPDPE